MGGRVHKSAESAIENSIGSVSYGRIGVNPVHCQMRANPTVFIVDDDPSVTKTICALVESEGLAAQAFGTAEEFLGAHEPTSPACLLLDVHLPGMSGLELLEKLNAEGVKLPVIIITGDADAALVARIRQAGAFEFVDKSTAFRRGVLIDCVWRALFLDADNQHERGPARGQSHF